MFDKERKYEMTLLKHHFLWRYFPENIESRNVHSDIFDI